MNFHPVGSKGQGVGREGLGTGVESTIGRRVILRKGILAAGNACAKGGQESGLSSCSGGLV